MFWRFTAQLFIFIKVSKFHVQVSVLVSLVLCRPAKVNAKGYIEDFIFHQDTLFIAVNNSIYKLKNELIIDSIKEINYAKIGTVNKMISIKNNLLFILLIVFTNQCELLLFFKLRDKAHRKLP